MEEKEIKTIDFISIAKKLWPYRRKYVKVMGATLVISYLVIVCIPRYYNSNVSLAPEATGASMAGSLGSLASSFGLGNTLGKLNSEDAIYSEIYPDVISSKNFLADLMSVEVKTQQDEKPISYYVYLRDKQKSAWWVWVKDKIVNLFKTPSKDNYDGKTKLDIFNLSKVQSDIFGLAKSKIKCTVDKKTDIVSITVTDQNPLVSATIANATCQKLQEFIINYRTNKARIDYEYYKKLCENSKKEYENALQRYATNSDANRNAVLATYQAHIESLENEMQAKYNVYTAMNTQMQAAAAKLQEATPAFTVIESASIPIKPAGPKRMLISIAIMLLSFFALTGWLLMKEDKQHA